MRWRSHLFFVIPQNRARHRDAANVSGVANPIEMYRWKTIALPHRQRECAWCGQGLSNWSSWVLGGLSLFCVQSTEIPRRIITSVSQLRKLQNPGTKPQTLVDCMQWKNTIRRLWHFPFWLTQNLWKPENCFSCYGNVLLLIIND